jgi:hypothetical protein
MSDVAVSKDTLSRHTPGPWTWEVHPTAKRVQIVGRGLTVMDFVRWGMTGAAPRFLSREHLLDRADELLQVVPGREHHAHWHQTINHPDARLIATAPDLLAAAQAAWNCIGELPPTQARVEVGQMLCAAIKKATGATE